MAQDVITRLRLESGEFNAKIKTATNELNRMTTVAEQEGVAIAAADAKNIKFFQSLGKMQTASTSTSGKIRELSASLESAVIVYNRMDAAMRKGEGGRALAASITQLQGRLKGLQGEMAAVQGKIGMMGAGGGGMGIAAQFGSGLQSAAAMFGPAALAIGGVTAAIGGLKKVMGDIVSINMQFEQGTAVLASIMGKTTDEITALTNQAKQLGATTRYTAMQITELQTNLARLGFNESEILNSTKAVQALATATGADLGEAANLAGAALRGFGMNSTEMERATSVLAVSTTKSALSFEKLATAVPIVAPVAKQFGFTIEDTVTLLGKLSDAGMDASSAATATRNIFLKMADSGGKLSQAMGRPVHSVEEFGEALKEMREKGMSLNDILKMVGVRSTAAFAVFADNADTLKDFKQSITDCSEAMHDMEDKQINTLQGSVTILGSAWEGLMLTFSESNGTIKKVTDGLTNLLTAYTNWRKRQQGGDAAIATFELGMSEEQQKTADQVIAGYRAGGSTDDQIAEILKKDREKVEKEVDEMTKVYKKWKDAENQLISGRAKDEVLPEVQRVFGDLKGGNWSDQMAQIIAGRKDQLTLNDYMLSAVTPAPSATAAPAASGSGGSVGGAEKDLTSKRRAQIEAQMQEDIAALDKANMIKLGKESEYEDNVYQIKRAALEQIKQLYAEDSKEYAQIRAKIAQLDIQYQGTQANKSKGSTAKHKEEKILNYSQEGISNLGSQIKSAMSKSEIGSEGYLLAADQLLDFTTFEGLLRAATERGVQPDPEWMASLFEDIKIGADVDDSTWQALVDDINAKLAELKLPPITLDVKTGSVKEAEKEMGGLTENVQGAIGVFGQLGGAMQQIEDPGAKVAGMIMEAIAGIAATFAASLKGTFTPWDWIAAAISGTATMIGVISSIKSVTSGSYASGGIIPGNSFSGDNLTANVNSGELILNRAQQGSIASQLQGAAQQTVVVEGRISGKDILLSANNTNRAAGGSRGYYANVH